MTFTGRAIRVDNNSNLPCGDVILEIRPVTTTSGLTGELVRLEKMIAAAHKVLSPNALQALLSRNPRAREFLPRDHAEQWYAELPDTSGDAIVIEGFSSLAVVVDGVAVVRVYDHKPSAEP